MAEKEVSLRGAVAILLIAIGYFFALTMIGLITNQHLDRIEQQMEQKCK